MTVKARFALQLIVMNIIFCPMDGGEDQEEFVKDKLLMLHQAHPSITGAQVNFCVGKGDAGFRAARSI